MGANAHQLAAVAFSRLQKELAKDGREPTMGPNKSISRKDSDGRSRATAAETSALSQFCVNLTARASEGQIDPVIGREVEVQRIIQILCRKTKCNPILLGAAGVGKTAIAEGLAIRIARADVAPFLLTKRVMSLDVAMLMAGAKERGELEERVTKLIKEIIKSGEFVQMQMTSFFSLMKFIHLFNPGQVGKEIRVLALTLLIYLNLHLEGINFRKH